MTTRKAAFAALSLLAAFTSLSAYVLPSTHVLGNWIEKIKAVQTLHVRQTTTIFDAKLSGGSVTVEEEIWIRRPSEYRRTTFYPNGKFDVVVGKDRVVRIWGGKPDLIPLAEALGPLGALYLYPDKGRLNGFLRQVGVDLDQTRWVLREKQIGLEIGDPKGARLTLSKQDSLPMGAVIGEKSHRFDMAAPEKFPIRYPSHIEMTVGENLSEKTEVLSVETNVRVDDNLFEIPRAPAAPGKK